MSLRDDCSCGHARDSHFEKAHNCLALNCECKAFDAERKARIVTPVAASTWSYRRRPHEDTSCLCDGCRAWLGYP